MVEVAGVARAAALLRSSLTRLTVRALAVVVLVSFFYASCTTRVRPNEWGVEQRKFGLKVGIVDKAYGAGLYFVGPGAAMHTFPRELHVLEASYDRQESEARARSMGGRHREEGRPVLRAARRAPGRRHHPPSGRGAERADLRRLRGHRGHHPRLHHRRPREDRPGVRLGLALRGRLRPQHLPQQRALDPGQDERRVVLRRGAAHRSPGRVEDPARRALQGARLRGEGAAAPQLPLRRELREGPPRQEGGGAARGEEPQGEPGQRGAGQAQADRVEGQRGHHHRGVRGADEDRQGARRGRALRLPDPGPGRQGDQRGPGRGQAPARPTPSPRREGATWWPWRRPRCSRTSRGRS